MDQNQHPDSPVPHNPQDDVQSLRDRVRQLEEELARNKARADARPQSAVPPQQTQREQHAFVRDMVARMNEMDRTALHDWAMRLLQLRQSGDTMLNKASQALSATIGNKAALPSIKLLAREAKRRAWDQQGTGGRVAVGAGLLVAVMMGPGVLLAGTAGVAAGFPLWLVFGSGDALLHAVVEATRGPDSSSTPVHVPVTVVDSQEQPPV